MTVKRLLKSGHAGGQLAYCIHLLRLSQLRLGSFTPGHRVARLGQRLLAPGAAPGEHRQQHQPQYCRPAKIQLDNHHITPAAQDRVPSAPQRGIERIALDPLVGNHLTWPSNADAPTTMPPFGLRAIP